MNDIAMSNSIEFKQFLLREEWLATEEVIPVTEELRQRRSSLGRNCIVKECGSCSILQTKSKTKVHCERMEHAIVDLSRHAKKKKRERIFLNC